jgi:hypothetical protein
MPSSTTARLLTLLTGMLLASPALAHDFWLVPSTFQPKDGAPVDVQVLIGHPGQSEPFARDETHFEAFVAQHSGPALPVAGEAGRDPAGTVSLPSPGTWMLLYRSRHRFVQLTPEKFTSYLDEEGLTAQKSAWLAGPSAGRPQREIYSRCAKAFVTVGAATPATLARTVGCRLELTSPSATSPSAGKSNDKSGAKSVAARFEVELRFDGAPIGDVQVKFTPLDGSAPAILVRTDKAGRASAELPSPGGWLASAVHLTAMPAGANLDWESFWASLVFERPEAATLQRGP